MKTYLAIISFFFSAIGLAQVDTLWTQVYGGSDNEPVGFGSGFAGAPSVHAETDDSGNIFLVTFTDSNDGDISSNKGLEDVWVLKLDSEGDTLWTKTIGGSSFDRAYRVRVTEDQGCVIAGRTSSNDGDFTGSNGSEDGFVVKLNADGDLEWSNLYGGSLVDNFFGMEIIGDRYLVYGATGSIDGDVPAGSPGSVEAWVVFMDNDGDILWSEKTSASTADSDWSESFWSAVEINDGVVLAGMTGNAFDFNTDDFFIAMYDTLGNQIWTAEYGSGTSDAIGGITEIDNYIYLTGRVNAGTGDVSSYAGGTGDVWLAKIDSNGVLINEKNYGGSDYEYSYFIQESLGNNLLISGLTRSTDGDLGATSYGGFDFWVLEVDTSFTSILNQFRFGGSANDYAHGILAETPFDFVLYGRSQSSGDYVPSNNGGTDIYLTKIQTAINDLGAASFDNEVLIYPNPNNGDFRLSNLKAGESYEIYNLLGERVYQGIYNGETIHVELPTNLYVLTTGEFVVRFIIE